jgi:ATP-dependent DNA ligase
LEQEFVIGGYTDPEGGRKHFGALLVGFYEGKRLKFAGRVGTEFSDKLLNSLRSELEKILMKGCPFYNVPAAGRSRWDRGLTAADMKRCHWVKPKLVCQVNSRSGRAMIAFVSLFFSRSEKTRTRARSSRSEQVRPLVEAARCKLHGFLLTSNSAKHPLAVSLREL